METHLKQRPSYLKPDSIFFAIVLLLMITGCTFPFRKDQPVQPAHPTTIAGPIQTTSVITPTRPEDLTNLTPVPSPKYLNYDWYDRSVFSANLVPAARDVLTERYDRSVYHLNINISDDLRTLHLEEEILYTNHEVSPISKIILRMYPSLMGAKVSFRNFSLNDEAMQPSISHQNSLLEFDLEEELRVGESVVISTELEIEMPEDPSGNYQMFGVVSNLLTLAHFFPMVAVYDEAGWHKEIPAQYGDIIYADASYFIVQVEINEKFQVVSSGNEILNVNQGDHKVITIAGGPMRDFYLAIGSDLVSNIEKVGDTIVTSYSPSSLNEGSLAALDAAASAIKIFNTEIGPYPYSEFDVLATYTKALGVEYPGITAINSDLYLPGQGKDGTPNSIYLESTVAHEVGHQWFYSTVGNDQINHPWLDEALTQYITGLYYTERYGHQASSSYQSSWYSRWDRVKRESIPIGLPVKSYDPEYYSPIVYGRGPLFFKSLSEEIGEEKFNSFLRSYYDENMWENSNPSIIKKTAEEACTCDLTTLFDEWVNQ